MKTVVIDRSKWRTGGFNFEAPKTGIGETVLCNMEGFKCCLGFAVQQVEKVDEDSILHSPQPKEYYQTHKAKGGINIFAPIEDEAIDINDGILPLKEKEAKLIPLFAKIGIDLQFVGKYRFYEDLENGEEDEQEAGN